MRNSSPPPTSPRWRWFVALSSLLAFIGTVALMRRGRKPLDETLPAQLVNEPYGTGEAALPPSPLRSFTPSPPERTPLPPRLQLLSLVGLTIGAVLCGVGLMLIQEAAPAVASLLFTVMLVVGLLLFAVYYRQQIVTVLLWPPRFLLRFYRADSESSVPLHTSGASLALSLLILFALLVILLVLPVSSALALVLLLAVFAIIYFTRRSAVDSLLLIRRYLAYLRNAPEPAAVPLPALKWQIVAAECAVILVVSLFVTRFYQSPSPTIQFSGNESEWINSSAYAAASGLRQYGRIPLWQPYLEQGEPLVENPVGFIFSPFAILPSLLVGASIGVRVSVVIHVLLAGLGGWFLARVLGLGTVGRLLLALLLIGKGNMHAMLGSGYFQLAVSQVYLPWIISGVVGLIRLPHSRWPVVMTALSGVLVFFTGNVWYILPTLVSAGCVALPYLVLVGKRWIDFSLFGRLLLMAVLTVGIGAVLVLPAVLQFNRIGKHPGEYDAGWSVPLQDVIPLYGDPNPNRIINVYFPSIKIHWSRGVNTLDEFYYSFITPGWFVLLLLLIPFYRPGARWERRLWLVAVLLAVLATLWGAGGNPLYIWLYQTFPFIAQWRFVGRALAVATFWIAVLVALRADSLWKIAFQTNWLKLGLARPFAQGLPVVLGAALLLGGGVAAAQVNDQWDALDGVIGSINPLPDRCISWLRQTNPDKPLSVWQLDYRHMTTFLNNRVRSWDIQSDFEMTALPSTVGRPELDLNNPYPEYAFIYDKRDHDTLLKLGYQPLATSPRFDGVYHCIYHRSDVIPYAYTVNWSDLSLLQMPYPTEKLAVPPQMFEPVTLLERQPDAITVRVDSPRYLKTLLGVQERAYPGWQAVINGQPAKVESVGGQIGVYLPLGDEPLVVTFIYRPPLVMLGGAITIISSLFCIVYLWRGRRKAAKV